MTVEAHKSSISLSERSVISEPISYYDMTFSCEKVLHVGAVRRDSPDAWMGTPADPN
jgi:hypothetical protein